MPRSLIISTSNAGKAKEARMLTEDWGVEVDVHDFGCNHREIQGSVRDIAAHKLGDAITVAKQYWSWVERDAALEAAMAVMAAEEEEEVASPEAAAAAAELPTPLRDGLLVVEDSALEMEALGGMPGPYVKPFFEAMGAAGLYEVARGLGRFGAVDVCVLACWDVKTGKTHVVTGRTEGTIVAPQGEPPRGFGWDPVFIPKGCGCSYAEMELDRKNGVSARASAYRQLHAILFAPQ